MKFVILFEDNPSVDPDIRQRHMAAHLSFLEDHAEVVEAAGPLYTGAGEGAGGVWIVDVDDAGVAEELVKEDPFWPTGLRKSYQVLAWTQVFANGAPLIQ